MSGGTGPARSSIRRRFHACTVIHGIDRAREFFSNQSVSEPLLQDRSKSDHVGGIGARALSLVALGGGVVHLPRAKGPKQVNWVWPMVFAIALITFAVVADRG
jgi:hypothetical protein